MGTFLKKLFESYARRLIIGTGKGIKQIPNKDRVKLMANNIYKDLKAAGVTDDMIKTENDIRNLHHQVAEMNKILQAFRDKGNFKGWTPKVIQGGKSEQKIGLGEFTKKENLYQT